MKPDAYAQALLVLVRSGEKPKKAIERLYAMLVTSGRTALMPGIARAFLRLAERDLRKHGSILYLAKKAHEKRARAATEAKEANVAVDPHLIGGWRLESEEQLIDASWKRHLLLLYNRVTK